MSNMRVDVVTGPVRYRLAPLFALVALAVVPVVALTALLVWSDGQADKNEAQVGSDDPVPQPREPAGAPSPALTTGVFSYRRAPTSVATAGDDNRLSDAMNELAFFIGEGSCLAVSVDGRPVLAHNADAPVIPASTHKLAVAAVALDVLGPDHRFTTEVAAPTPVDGVVEGDLVVIGGGDPLLVSADFPVSEDSQPAFNTTSLDVLADSVVAAGVTAIDGSILGDGSRYDDEFVIPSWGPAVAFVEAGPYDALVVNDARVLGRAARQRNPAEAAAREFTRLLRDRGVRITGGFGVGTADPAVAVLASVESEPLTAVLAEMLTTSDNDTAEMLLKELGVADSGEGTVAAGLNVVDRTLRAWGIPMDGVRLVDASGLSTDNRMTCAALLALLQRVQGSPVAAGLPVAGASGTLQEAFAGTALEGRLIAKSGTLGNPPANLDPPAVKGLAGYLPTPDGRTIEFVMILNGPDISNPDNYLAYWTALGDRLAAYPAGPDPASVGPR
jgi:D-alanyl-D-alanine carboxypeptidase/D-alanyl-D-alanine-endopeptidase (penicillin-binding protein 4)